jgi:hypothetical protein
MRDTQSKSLDAQKILFRRDPEPFDWYQRFSGLKDLIAEVVKPDDKILNLGCGNSSKEPRISLTNTW